MTGWHQNETPVGRVRTRTFEERQRIHRWLGPAFDRDLDYDLVTQVRLTAYRLEGLYGLDYTPAQAVSEYVRAHPDPEAAIRWTDRVAWAIVAT